MIRPTDTPLRRSVGPYPSALVAVLAITALFGCHSKAPEDAVVAKSNDHEITLGLFAAYTQQMAGGKPEQLDKNYRERLLQQLVQLTIAAEREAALEDRSTAYAAELERLRIFARAGATRAGVFAEPSSAELRAAYDAFVGTQPPAEFHVAHILVPTEALAFGVIRRLGQGANFASLAKAESVDESNTLSGDLGWVRPGHLPKLFTDAASSLKPGDYTRQPVKTQYGWHVIRLLETRPATVPPLAEVHAQLVENLKQKRYAAFLGKR